MPTLKTNHPLSLCLHYTVRLFHWSRYRCPSTDPLVIALTHPGSILHAGMLFSFLFVSVVGCFRLVCVRGFIGSELLIVCVVSQPPLAPPRLFLSPSIFLFRRALSMVSLCGMYTVFARALINSEVLIVDVLSFLRFGIAPRLSLMFLLAVHFLRSPRCLSSW